MKYWAEFYRINDKGAYVDVLGDRGILRIDARLSRINMHTHAREWAIKHKFDGFRIARGDNLLRLFYLDSAVVPVTHKENENV